MLHLLVRFEVAAVLAVVLHEAAHCAVACLLHVRIKRVGINWHGVYVQRESGSLLQNTIISLAGPLANLLVAGVVVGNVLSPKLVAAYRVACDAHTPAYAALLVTGCFALLYAPYCTNMVVGVYNLLPVPASDGLRVYKLLWRAAWAV